MATRNESPFLAGPPGHCCVQSVKHTGTPVGKVIKLADVDTYISEPPRGGTGPKKVILYLADIFGPFYLNAKLLQDYFASHGYIVLGIDYFFGDAIEDLNLVGPDFDLNAWIAKSVVQAREAFPRWLKAVREEYGADTQYSAVGYCFGAPFATELAATDNVVAAAFAHPAMVTEDHLKKLTKPLLLLCAEIDPTFPTESRRRAEDILIETKATYHIRLFSGVEHAFATRGDPHDENTSWAKEQAAHSVVEWFDRFNKSEC